ncbi:MAG: glycine--tRNA ligase subunit beta [Gammaproteobacteria bacterium]|nr:glycine--tRNA ligase subunit beta [Gammaproteobacteria bacterium]
MTKSQETEKRDLLIEIGTEELPPKALRHLSDAFNKGIREGLDKAGLTYSELKGFATPRRLAVLIKSLDAAQHSKEIERKGPSLTAAFDDEGCPTKAAQGFARSCGLENVEDLDKIETDKGSWLVFRIKEEGKPTSELVPGILQMSLDKLPIPKRMRWSDLDVQFVRPVHWAVILFGDEVIDAEVLSVKSGRETRGHRFHHPENIYIGEPAAYEPVLETQGHVVADFDDRREAIRGQVMEIAATVKGNAVIDDDLLDEVTSMVEWPVAVLGNFEERFLDVPSEALVSAMKGHQKYFHVVDKNGKLMPHFITISNVDSSDIAVVRAGNERVIRPRLSDAAFFWNQDRKKTLAERTESLKTVVFQNKLGTLYDKVVRISTLAAYIAKQLNGDEQMAQRAAHLCKCDLMTEMVGEFPDLQGVMGRYYAVNDGEPEEIAAAIDEHYMPRFAGDKLPTTVTAQAVSIAEKLDTLVGIFGIGQIPTGDKDPFALRRAALGVLRIIIEGKLDINLAELLGVAAVQYMNVIWELPKKPEKKDTDAPSQVAVQVFDFMMGRLRIYYQDQGITADVFDAVYAQGPTRPLDFDSRLHAVTSFRKLAEAESLAAANKRISNILKKTDTKIPEHYNADLLKDDAEKALASRLGELEKQLKPMFDAREYEAAMKQLATLRDSVDQFFDDVMVMVDDESLRDNRLALLSNMRSLFLQVADLSILQ